MSEPRTIYQQMQQDFFTADEMIVVYFAQKDYDAVYIQDPVTGEDRPFYSQIDTAQSDCLGLRKAVIKYRITENDKYYYLQNPSHKKFQTVYKEIEDTIKKNPESNYVVLHLFACHGIHKKGTQYVALNEFDDTT